MSGDIGDPIEHLEPCPAAWGWLMGAEVSRPVGNNMTVKPKFTSLCLCSAKQHAATETFMGCLSTGVTLAR